MLNVSVGQTASRSLTLTEGYVRTFAELTGDYNPLHFNEAFAAATRFGRRVVRTAHATKPVAQLGVTVRRQDGVVVLEGQAWCYTLKPAGNEDRHGDEAAHDW